jgi:hypothetical protein
VNINENELRWASLSSQHLVTEPIIGNIYQPILKLCEDDLELGHRLQEHIFVQGHVVVIRVDIQDIYYLVLEVFAEKVVDNADFGFDKLEIKDVATHNALISLMNGIPSDKDCYGFSHINYFSEIVQL